MDFLTSFECVLSVSLTIYIETTTGYARVLLFMFLRRELGGTGTGCFFQFTYCALGTRKISILKLVPLATQAGLTFT